MDYGDRKCTEKLATSICSKQISFCQISQCNAVLSIEVLHFAVFYLRSFKKEVSVPISWWPTTTTPPHLLASMFWEVVAICEENNVHINVVVADGATTNGKFFEIIGGKLDLSKPYTCPSPRPEGNPILTCLDTSHLLKVCAEVILLPG